MALIPDGDCRFIGRQRELEALHAALECTLQGQPRVVLLAGEPGIGKTRTAQEIIAHAAQRDVLALWARCPEEPGAPPYWPWLQLIRRYCSLRDESVLRPTIGSAARYFATLDPELTRGWADTTAPPMDTDPVATRFRLFDSISGFWQRACAQQPVLLVFDDLHRADVPSLRLLEFVIAEASGCRLMLLGTYRDAEITRQHPLATTLSELHRFAHVQRLLLGGLSAAETVQFAAAAGVDSADVAMSLYVQTEGHPLFLAELARDLRQAREASATHLIAARAGSGRVPQGVRDVIGVRLNRLSPRCIRVLQNASVIGREFRLDLLCGLLDGVPEERCLAALDEARGASLIDDSAERVSYQFTHALVRDTLYDEIPTTRRASLHQAIAAALELRFRENLTPWLTALAHHYHAAGNVPKAIEYTTRAAERAKATQAHEEAVRHYLLACQLLPTGGALDEQRCCLLLGLGDARLSASDSTGALATFAEASAYARRVRNASLLARSAVGVGDAHWRLGSESSKAVALIEEALALTRVGDSPERVSLLSALCRAQLFSNRPDEAEHAFREAVVIARRLGNPVTLFGALSAIVPGRWFPDQLELRIEAAREAIELVQHAPHLEWPASALSGWHAGDLMEAGDTASAVAAARSHLADAETTREPLMQAGALAALAMIATHEGRFAEAEHLAKRALEHGKRFDQANAAGIFGVQMFTLRRHQGRLGEIAPVLRQFQQSQAATWRPGLAILHCELGSRDEARAEFEALALNDFAGIAHDALRTASLAYLAEVCVWLGDIRRAATLFDLLLPYAERNIVLGAQTASLGSGARLLGMLAATLQRWDVAQHHFEYALAFDVRTGGRPWLAHSRCDFGAMLLQRGDAGDHDRALGLLENARAEASALGMCALKGRVLALQARADTGGAPKVCLAGLSQREIQVLQLVAAGRTNQEIATILCRSPNTVAVHVRSILAKTRAVNRAEAAAFAARHGLLPTA